MATQTGGATPRSISRVFGVSPTDWRVQLLNSVGAPVTWPNLDGLQAWALSESGYNSSYGTNLAGPLAYNPLAITDSYGVPTVGDVNSAGVKQFGSTAAGVDATSRFLQHGYGNVIQALRDSNPDALYSAVNQSGWCAGCEGGNYPVALHDWLGGSSFSGEHGAFHGTEGTSAAARASQQAASAAAGDSGGLYGGCGGGTSLPLVSFSLPPFGCYLVNTVEFLVPAIGGTLLMLVGAYLVVRNTGGVAGKISQIPAAGGAVVGLAGQLGKLTPEGRAASLAGGASKAVGAGAGETGREERAARAAELHAERVKQQRARTREARARARVQGHRATQERLATGSSTRLSSVEEARIRRAQSRVGNRHPERMSG